MPTQKQIADYVDEKMYSTAPTAPTAGAKKAAQKLISIDEVFTPFRDMSMDRIASIIDEETHAGELLEALKGLVRECAMVHKTWGDSCNQLEADAAIKRAEAAIASATKE